MPALPDQLSRQPQSAERGPRCGALRRLPASVQRRPATAGAKRGAEPACAAGAGRACGGARASAQPARVERRRTGPRPARSGSGTGAPGTARNPADDRVQGRRPARRQPQRAPRQPRAGRPALARQPVQQPGLRARTTHCRARRATATADRTGSPGPRAGTGRAHRAFAVAGCTRRRSRCPGTTRAAAACR
ncbi:hypothetical protein D9M71_574110 [compost metagenome]